MKDLTGLKTATDRVELELEIRQSVLTFARAELGNRDPARYFIQAAPCYQPQDWLRKSWCQIFCLYCYQLARLTARVWHDQTGFVGALPTIDRVDALPADMTILENTRDGRTVWHGNLFVTRAGNRDYTIDGNTSEGVAERDRDIREYHPRPVYKSIQPWVDELAEALDSVRGLVK